MNKVKGDHRHKKRYVAKKEGKKKDMTNVKRCLHCGHEMRARGASDSAGSASWKCKNNKCGRTVWERKAVKPPVPLVYTSHMDKVRMRNG